MDQHTITRISNTHDGSSIFEQITYPLSDHNNMWISSQQSAVNFRHRKSPSGYQSDWHVAGDPTLIIICHGVIEIQLANGDTKSFSQGDQFIAADFLPEGKVFTSGVHGHRARVLGQDELLAVHIKLEKLKP